jgi:hypothetical protein
MCSSIEEQALRQRTMAWWVPANESANTDNGGASLSPLASTSIRDTLSRMA